MKRRNVTSFTAASEGALTTGSRVARAAVAGLQALALLTVGLTVTVSSSAALTGCNRAPEVNPVREAVNAYKIAVEPPLARSEEIARLFVQIVTDGQGKPDPDQAAKRIEAEVLPKAKEFSDLINAIQVTEPSVQEVHQHVVLVAKLRLEGYQQVVKGYTEKNLDLFSEGQKKLRDSKVEEEEFSSRALALMRSQGLELAFFTQPAIAR